MPRKTAIPADATPPRDETLKAERIVITPPKFEVAIANLIGTDWLAMNRFPEKARQMIKKKQEEGSTAAKGKKKDPKNFAAAYEASKHVSTEGWLGLPCSAFRNALISTCRMTGFQIVRAKMSVFILADGHEADGTPLVRLHGKPEQKIHPARNATGVVDLRTRAFFAPGWKVRLRIKYDADQFTQVDIANLVLRAGIQNGIGDGRPNSKASNGMGWGTFTIEGNEA